MPTCLLYAELVEGGQVVTSESAAALASCKQAAKSCTNAVSRWHTVSMGGVEVGSGLQVWPVRAQHGAALPLLQCSHSLRSLHALAAVR